MKKIIAVAFLMNLLVPFIAAASFAPDPNDQVLGELGNKSYQVTNLDTTLSNVANYVVVILVVIATFYIIWAGYDFVTGSDDTTKIEGARKKIMYAAIGIIVALSAKGIVALVVNAIK